MSAQADARSEPLTAPAEAEPAAPTPEDLDARRVEASLVAAALQARAERLARRARARAGRPTLFDAAGVAGPPPEVEDLPRPRRRAG